MSDEKSEKQPELPVEEPSAEGKPDPALLDQAVAAWRKAGCPKPFDWDNWQEWLEESE